MSAKMDSRQLYEYLFRPTLLKLFDLAKRENGIKKDIGFCIIKRPGNSALPFEVCETQGCAIGLESDAEWTGHTYVAIDTNQLKYSGYLIEQTKSLLAKLTQRDFVPFWVSRT